MNLLFLKFYTYINISSESITFLKREKKLAYGHIENKTLSDNLLFIIKQHIS